VCAHNPTGVAFKSNPLPCPSLSAKTHRQAASFASRVILIRVNRRKRAVKCRRCDLDASPWVYPDPSIPSQVLRMDPGSEIHLEIQLKPVHDRSLPVSKFLIPEGYVGWLRVEYDVECFPPIPGGDGVRILRFARANVLETSSPMPEDAAERRYFYYAEDGSERNLAADYRNGNGMIWQETSGSRSGKMRMFIFFVGTEKQSKTRPHTGFLAPVCP